MDNFMDNAFCLAQKAFDKNEIPVGCVVVCNNKIIGGGYNKRNKSKIATDHAEIIAIQKACKAKKTWRLDDCVLYVTLTPCPMCAGAILNARIKKVVIGAMAESKTCKVCNEILTGNYLNHTCEMEYLNDKNCSKILTDFFDKKRKNKN